MIGSRETLTQLLAGLGLIGSAGVLLAAQDTLKNFFGTLLLIGERLLPDRRAHRRSGHGGGGRAGRLPLDPAANVRGLAANYPQLGDGRGPDRQPGRQDSSWRFRAVVPLDYGAPIDKVVVMRDALRAFAMAQPRFLPDKVEVHIVGLGANGVELLVQAYFRVAGTSEELACCDLLCREILEQAGRLGIDVALAARTVHLASYGTEQHPVPPRPKLVGRERSEALRHGLPADGEPRGRRNCIVARGSFRTSFDASRRSASHSQASRSSASRERQPHREYGAASDFPPTSVDHTEARKVARPKSPTTSERSSPAYTKSSTGLSRMASA